MLDLAGELTGWLADGRDFAVATVTGVGGSAPREPGATLAVAADGTVLGSVSGGCVEGAVYELCRQALADGTPVVERFGYADADALAVGLTCGGSVEVLVAPVRADDPARPVCAAALRAAAGGEAAALVRIVTGPPGPARGALLVRAGGRWEGTLGGPAALDASAAAEAAAHLAAGRTGTVRLGDGLGDGAGGVTVLVETRLPPPRLLVYGAGDFAAALVTAGAFLGHRVTVCDARPLFAAPDRFPGAADVVTDWPHRHLDDQWRRGLLDARTAVCVLTHDAKFDVPVLARALTLPLGYVGAMGSRRTHDDRLRRLRAAGVTERRLARLRSPVGLDLGARTPQETALSIAAEIVALRHGGTGRPLTGLTGPVHCRTRAVESGHDTPHDGPAADLEGTEPRAA